MWRFNLILRFSAFILFVFLTENSFAQSKPAAQDSIKAERVNLSREDTEIVLNAYDQTRWTGNEARQLAPLIEKFIKAVSDTSYVGVALSKSEANLVTQIIARFAQPILSVNAKLSAFLREKKQAVNGKDSK